MAGKLRPKYQVQRITGDNPKKVYGLVGKAQLSTDLEDINSPFVLMPRKDPAAFRAMICYALYCEPDLRAEIAEWLNKIAATEPVFGTQGARNYAEMRAREISLGL